MNKINWSWVRTYLLFVVVAAFGLWAIVTMMYLMFGGTL